MPDFDFGAGWAYYSPGDLKAKYLVKRPLAVEDFLIVVVC